MFIEMVFGKKQSSYPYIMMRWIFLQRDFLYRVRRVEELSFLQVIKMEFVTVIIVLNALFSFAFLVGMLYVIKNRDEFIKQLVDD